MLIFDKQILFIKSSDNINALTFKVNGKRLEFGNSFLEINEKTDKKVVLNNQTFNKIILPLKDRFDLMVWSSKERIKNSKLGIIQWILLDPLFMEGANPIGSYSITGSWIGLSVVSLTVIILIAFISEILFKKD